MAERGVLYVIATPIGNLADLSPRAVETLKNVDCILAEDTRHSRRLAHHFDVRVRLSSCHQHNELEKTAEVLAGLEAGLSYALISDAGTPVFSDPGAQLIAAVLEKKLRVVPIPGPCAAITALSVSGFRGLPFHFYGFLPVKASQKRKFLLSLKRSMSGTLGFYEAPHRLLETLELFSAIWGCETTVVLAKELTKLHEHIHRNSLTETLAWLEEDTKRGQGEFVLLIEQDIEKVSQEEYTLSLDHLLHSCCACLSLKEAVNLVVHLTGLSKNRVYDRALVLKENSV